jgi:hypothetical protein
MTPFDATQYGPTFATLLATDRNRPLDEGQPDSSVGSQLSGLTAAAAFDHTTLADGEMAAACVSGVWLLYDHLDDSHRISQGISTPAGSFWHGIMHRREGDYSNAKYWFGSVGRHGVYDDLARVADELAIRHRAAGVLPAGQWDPMAFVDVCQQVVRGGGEHQAFCRAVQQAEWELLFDDCYRHAVGY